MFNRRAKAKTKIRIKKEVFEKMVATLGSQIPEKGGYTIGDIEGDKVTINDFIYDYSANTSSAAYSPDIAIMSPKIITPTQLRKDWSCSCPSTASTSST